MSARLDAHIARLKARGYDWPIPWADVEALGYDEDCRTVAYRCVAGKPSIGWAETEGVTMDMRWTVDQCDARFMQQVVRYARKVEAMCTVPPNPNQLGAFVRLAYNIGFAALAKSTALRKHNEGDFEAAARAISLFDKYTDPQTKQLRVSPVLSARRARERARYLTPVDDTPREGMPQAVTPESSLAASPIAQGGAVTAATGAAAGASALADQFGTASGFLASLKGIGAEVADFVGLPPKVMLAAVLVAAGCWVWNWRRRQREGGWA